MTAGPAAKALNRNPERLFVGGLVRVARGHVGTQLGEGGTKIEVGHGFIHLKCVGQGTGTWLTER